MTWIVTFRTVGHDLVAAMLAPVNEGRFTEESMQLVIDFFAWLFASHPYTVAHHLMILVHVTFALFCLLVAPLVMIVRKGGKVHRRWGKAYFWGMFVTNGSALVLLFWRFNPFLLGVTVLSFYAAITGYRVIYRKRTPQQTPLLDRGLAWAALTAGLLLILWGGLTALGWTGTNIPSAGGMLILLGILPVFFGFSIAQSAWTDLRSFRQPSTDARWWWYYHMDRMLGSYLALLTALMVQRVGPYLPGSVGWIVWVAPGLLGGFAVGYWINHYRRKFSVAQPALVPHAQEMQEQATT